MTLSIKEEVIFIYHCQCSSMIESRNGNSSIKFGTGEPEYWQGIKKTFIYYPILYQDKEFRRFRFQDFGGYFFHFFIEEGKEPTLKWYKIQEGDIPAEKVHQCAINDFFSSIAMKN